MKIAKFFIFYFFFQTYGTKNTKLVASKRRRSSSFAREIVLFPKIYIEIYIFLLFGLLKMTHLFVPTNFNEKSKLPNSI